MSTSACWGCGGALAFSGGVPARALCERCGTLFEVGAAGELERARATDEESERPAYDRFLGIVEQTIGPTSQRRGKLRGRDVEIAADYHPGGEYPFGGCDIIVPFACQDVLLTVARRALVATNPWTHEVTTGDASFDAAFKVMGYPREALPAVLDERTRRWIMMCSMQRPLTIRPGRVVIDDFGWRSHMTAAHLAHWIDNAFDVADRTQRIFDERREARRRAGGEAEVQRWLAEERASMENVEMTRKTGEIVKIGLIALGALLALGVAAAAVIAFFLLR